MKKNSNNDSKKIFTLLVIIFTLMICTTSATYAYLAFSTSNSNTVVGTTATASLKLDVERVLPGNVGPMVPQLEQYLGSAISNTYNCIDDNGNTVCQVYKATVTNESTATVKVNGTIKFSGIENMSNLKWKRITDVRTIGSYESNIASTSSVIFEKNRTFVKDESDIYYFVVWLDETGATQTDNGTFRVTIEFKPAYSDGITSTIVPLNEYTKNVMIPTAISDKNIDFSKTSEQTNTNGVYYIEDTKNDPYPIYYYRGNVNNNVIFANTCWKVVRTTETGGLKLIYNGLPSNGQCNNTGTLTQIGVTKFNGEDSDKDKGFPQFVGYMYGDSFSYGVCDFETNILDVALSFGNGVTYSNNRYSLVDTITGTFGSFFDNGLINHHYFLSQEQEGDESGLVAAYVYATAQEGGCFFTLFNGNKIEDALSEMLDNNTNSSDIKENVDSWYAVNIEQAGYSNYIEDTIWCNDRSIYSLGGFNPNGGKTYMASDADFYDTMLGFSVFEKFFDATPTPNLSCKRDIDKFTKNESSGNGNLDYPVGLLTADEIVLAGSGTLFASNTNYYLYTGQSYWGMTPVYFSGLESRVTSIDFDGILNGEVTNYERGIRPVISLKNGFTINGGSGTASSPYMIS